jgi:hypothetical protein
MSRARDTQRSRVYAAERAVEWTDGHLTLEECRALARRISTSAWFRRTFAWSGPAIEVKDGRGCRRALGGGSSITLPKWARQYWVVLHEIAHCVTPSRYAAHGPEFVDNLMRLIRHVLGVDAYRTVRDTFAEYGIRGKGGRRLAACRGDRDQPSAVDVAALADATGTP